LASLFVDAVVVMAFTQRKAALSVLPLLPHMLHFVELITRRHELPPCSSLADGMANRCAKMVQSSTSSTEALFWATRRSSPLRAAKWFVPGDTQAAGDGSSLLVEKIKDWIAFRFCFPRSFVLFARTSM
jgi:hypothetical protein